MEEYFRERIVEVEGSADVSYLLENNDFFYDVGFKVMQNQENDHLMKCHRLKYNGRIKLVYFTKDYVSIGDYMKKVDEDSVLNIISSLIETLMYIENLGFLDMACIDNRLSHLYMDELTHSVKAIYLPINLSGIHKSKNEFDNEIKSQLLQELQGLDFCNSHKMRCIIDSLEDGTLKLHDIDSKVRMLCGDFHRNKEEEERKFDSNVETANSSVTLTKKQGMTLKSLDGKIEFAIDRTEYIIGKSNEKADGVIVGNTAVSRVHCKIIKVNSDYYLEDLTSWRI